MQQCCRLIIEINDNITFETMRFQIGDKVKRINRRSLVDEMISFLKDDDYVYGYIKEVHPAEELGTKHNYYGVKWTSYDGKKSLGFAPVEFGDVLYNEKEGDLIEA